VKRDSGASRVMSSRMELVQGCDEGGVTGSELAKICQAKYMMLWGCNSIPPSRIFIPRS